MWFEPELNLSPGEIVEYLRKSRSDDPLLTVEEVLSRHETILNDWAEKNIGEKIPEENIFREVVSGETIADRPGIQKVLNLIESPKIKAILSVEVQRLSRGDLEDAGRLIKLLRYTNTLVITPTKTYDLTNEYDRDIFERELKRGNEFLEYQKKIMNRGRLLSVQQGNFIGSIPPYGYDKTWITDGKKKYPTLKINEAEADVVRMIFDMYVNKSIGRTNIANALNSLGIKPRKSERWTQSGVISVLTNPHCIGKVRWNWRKTVNIVEDGEITKTRPKNSADDSLLFEGKHERIISDELFYAAQERIGKTPRVKPHVKIRNPFSGLIYCQCGHAMTLRTYIKNGVERSEPRLLCDNQSYCHTSSCLYDEMLEKVCDILKSTIADFEVKMKNDNKDLIAQNLNHINKLEHKLTELEKKEINMWEKYTEEGMPKDIFEKLRSKLFAERQEIKDALSAAKQSVPTPVDYQDKICRFRDALNTLLDPDAPALTKNTLLKSCIQRINYSRAKQTRLTKTTSKTPLPTGGSWTAPPIELDVHLFI